MRFHRGYALAALAIFAIEVLIALYVRDRFVRPYLGDMLAVALVYCGLRAVTRLGVVPAISCALAIAFAVEFGQLANILDRLGWRDNRVASTVLGTGFDLKDLFAYTAGGLLILVIERRRRARVAKPPQTN